MGNGGVCGRCGDGEEEEGLDRDWTCAERAGGDGGMHAVVEGICEGCASRVCGGEAAVLGGAIEEKEENRQTPFGMTDFLRCGRLTAQPRLPMHAGTNPRAGTGDSRNALAKNTPEGRIAGQFSFVGFCLMALMEERLRTGR